MEAEAVAVEVGVAVAEGSCAATTGVLEMEGVDVRERMGVDDRVGGDEEDLEGSGEEEALADLVTLGVALGERERSGEEEGTQEAVPPPPMIAL